MSTQTEKPEYKVVKNFVGNDEKKALQNICKKHKKLPYLLTAQHTDKCFVWVDK
jgi:hypothetical protein